VVDFGAVFADEEDGTEGKEEYGALRLLIHLTLPFEIEFWRLMLGIAFRITDAAKMSVIRKGDRSRHYYTSNKLNKLFQNLTILNFFGCSEDQETETHHNGSEFGPAPQK
jgi:hypothetical protein